MPGRGHAGNAAIRVRPWKLVREEPNAWELYDLAKDRTELKDLSDNHPDGVSDLAARWSAWAARVGVVAWEATLSIYAERGLGPVEAAGSGVQERLGRTIRFFPRGPAKRSLPHHGEAHSAWAIGIP